MTAHNPRTRPPRRLASAAGLLALLAVVGCKSKDGGSGGSRDPLYPQATRIPPQNVPLPDRGGAIGAKNGKSDPLLDRPVSRDRTGVGYSDDPERFKGTYVPGEGTTPAAMAAKKTRKDDDGLKITGDENRVPLRPAGGLGTPADGGAVGTAGGAGGATGATGGNDGTDARFAELEKYGVKRDDRSLAREDGQYVFKAVAVTNKGSRRQYEGRGTTAADAVDQVLKQLAADRKDF